VPPEPRRNCLARADRLKKRSLIRPLFDRTQAQSVAAGSVRLLYRTVDPGLLPPGVHVQAAFLPGKRPTAVQRNRVRRALREVYRVHRHDLVDLAARLGAAVTLGILYRSGNADEASAAAARDLPRALERLCERLAQSTEPGNTA
jgi:ribonuclease P protein component